ncbi:MAG: T9SS type A sorting domain-containing protein [Moheibacter sp.]
MGKLVNFLKIKHTLFFSTILFFGGLIHAQEPIRQTDENGKIRFQTDQVNLNGQNENYQNPAEMNIVWPFPDVNISENPTQDSWDVRLAVGKNNGNAYVVYNDNYSNGLQKIMFRKKTGTDEWTEPIYVDQGGEIGARNNHFPAIAVAPNGDLHVTYNVWAFENVRNYIGYSYYDAATDTWSDGLKISDLGGTVNHFNSYHDVYSTDENYPVVVWGYDNRANQVNEEIYMKYFDGENWSADIPVSAENDGFDAGIPMIRKLGQGDSNKAMIIYSERISDSAMELRYRIYDETTHELSEPQTISSENIFSNNYAFSSSESETLVLTIHKENSPPRDVLNVYAYDFTEETFSLFPTPYEVDANAGGLLKRIDMDCITDNCGIVYSDFLAHTLTFLQFNLNEGFVAPEVVVQQNPGLDAPSIRMSNNGNVHLAWSDYRFDNGEGFDEREVFYKLGINNLLGTNDAQLSEIMIYPNPSKGKFYIATEKNYALDIFDFSGKRVYSTHISGFSEVQTKLVPGVYTVRLTNAKEVRFKKLIIK